MQDKSSIIEKVRFLINLGNKEGTPEHEAKAALSAANKLIDKFHLSEDDYKVEEVKPIYTDDDLLFKTKDLQDHLAQLALIVGNKYDCFVIQEINIAQDNDTHYCYFVYGDPNDVVCVKALFNFVKKEVDLAISMYCRGRGKLYINSFCEGLINGVRINIEQEDFHVEGLAPVKKEEKRDETALVAPSSSKKEPPPILERTDVGGKKEEKALDPIAFFTGEGKGRAIHIGKVDESLYLKDKFDDEKDYEYYVPDNSWLQQIKKILGKTSGEEDD